MKNLSLLFAFVLVCGMAKAAHTLPSSFGKRVSRPLPFITKALTTPALDGIYLSSITHPATSTWTALDYSAATSGVGGTITGTSDAGTPYTLNWSISGGTFYWSTDAVPVSGVNLEMHDFILWGYTDPYEQSWLINKEYEDGDYGNVEWNESGNADVSDPSLVELEFFWQVITDDGTEVTFDAFISL